MLTLRFPLVRHFDRNLGKDFFTGLPTEAGIYRVFNKAEELIYVGKAKNLRRRLGQYRNAKRRKRHAKMRAIIAEAARIEIELHRNEHEACRAEAILIRDLRPKWNVAGAFYFLYPIIGFSLKKGEARFLFTTEPHLVPLEASEPLLLHGAYRSRHLAGNGFFSLMALLEYLGHRNKTKKFGKYSYLYSFRQIDPGLLKGLDLFFRGESQDFLTALILELVEKAVARRKAAEVQECLADLARFWRHEALPLHTACLRTKSVYPVSQRERDLVFVDSRYGAMAEKLWRKNEKTETPGSAPLPVRAGNERSGSAH